MNAYVTQLTTLFQAILGRFSYIGANLNDYPLIIYIISVSIGIDACVFIFRLMKGE
jgi:hypothetical protein